MELRDSPLSTNEWALVIKDDVILNMFKSDEGFLMALWHFTFDLISSAVVAFDGVFETCMKLNRLDTVALDFDELRTQSLVDRIGMILPEKQEVTTGLRVWGEYESDDVQAGFDQAKVLEYVHFRLDVRDPSRSLMGKFCSLAHDFDCVFADDEGVIFRPDVEVLTKLAAQSDAARYVSDPTSYIRNNFQHCS